MDIREYFKELVFDAKHRTEGTIISKGSQHSSEFTNKGKYFYLTDEYIDNCPIGVLKDEIIRFTYKCFVQR
jgi:hypothetical protein